MMKDALPDTTQATTNRDQNGEKPTGAPSRFDPVPVRGEPVSTTLVRDRGGFDALHEYDLKMAALIEALEEGDASGIAEGDPFSRIRSSRKHRSPISVQET